MKDQVSHLKGVADPIGPGGRLVGPADLNILLSLWGPCSFPDDCPPDLNADAQVDGADLTILLGAWTAIAPPASNP